MKNYLLSEKDLEILRKSLPHGAQKEIAEKLKVSNTLVTNVLNNRAYSIRIIDEALKHYKKVVAKQREQLMLFKEIEKQAL